MTNLVRNARRATALAACLLPLALVQAEEIYKWVDKEGKTHYSSRKEDAQGAATTTMRPSPAQPAGPGPVPASRAANEDVIRREAPSSQPPTARPAQPQVAQPAAGERPRSRGDAGESDAAKCALARDILAGKAEHNNGSPIDAYDRQIAENDVRNFCRR